MGFADFYFTKFASGQSLINEKPAPDLQMVITIPCFNEQNTIKALESLYCCLPTAKPVEVIILINYPENKSPLPQRHRFHEPSPNQLHEIREYRFSTHAPLADWFCPFR